MIKLVCQSVCSHDLNSIFTACTPVHLSLCLPSRCLLYVYACRSVYLCAYLLWKEMSQKYCIIPHNGATVFVCVPMTCLYQQMKLTFVKPCLNNVHNSSSIEHSTLVIFSCFPSTCRLPLLKHLLGTCALAFNLLAKVVSFAFIWLKAVENKYIAAMSFHVVEREGSIT